MLVEVAQEALVGVGGCAHGFHDLGVGHEVGESELVVRQHVGVGESRLVVAGRIGG